MENKFVNLGDAVMSLKRIEFLLEQILMLQTFQIPIKSKAKNARNKVASIAFDTVDKDMKAFFESLPDFNKKMDELKKAI